MPNHEAYLRTALTKYRYQDLTKRDVLNVFQSFKDLRPKLDSFAFNDGSCKELMCLDGTIPVSYKENTYNIPVCIWLTDTHPYNPPMAYVKPTSSMQIKAGKHVDSKGKVYLPYMHEWKYPASDLLGLIQVLVIVFGEECPVFARSASQPARPSYSPATGGGNPPYPTSTELSQYRYADLVEQDISVVVESVYDFNPKLEAFVSNDGSAKQLLCLDGVLALPGKGNTYEIPVCIWLTDLHPYNPPMAFVKSTNSMQIKTGSYVDINGEVDLPYIKEWRHPSSDLLGLLFAMADAFEHELPITPRVPSKFK